MEQEEKDKSIWKYAGFMSLGALAFYQTTDGEETLVFTILVLLTVFCFVMFYRNES